ncbi:MAG: FMN-dependent alpha-hydroxy acid dehydrogenase, partial [Geminicoccaceae bacterium]|nr:FMN-dependent alpha-hydroxy acid dehydrogenase [Geminicoccaceae bacterium]
VFDPTLTWDDLDWLASLSPLPVLLKGILHPADAVLAVEYGARAILVSNHGGRQLDSAVAALDALPAVVEAVTGRVEVLVDGGVRRGTDVVKALALGARAVLIGRPIHWGLAVSGESGVRHVLELLRAELALDLMLCGLASPEEVGRYLDPPSIGDRVGERRDSPTGETPPLLAIGESAPESRAAGQGLVGGASRPLAPAVAAGVRPELNVMERVAVDHTYR